MSSHKVIAKEFCDQTSIHGTAFVVRHNLLPFKLFWSFVVLSGFTGLSLHLYSIVHGYLQYKSVESTYEKRNGFTFPDLSICNLKGISHSNLKFVAKNYSKIEVFYEHLMVNSLWDGNISIVPTTLFWALGNEAYYIGHKLDDMILSCSFGRQQCKKDDFVLFHFPKFFNCYRFTGGRNSDLITNYGQGAGLSLILYMEPDDPGVIQNYNKGVATGGTRGFRFLLEPPNYLAAIGNDGYYTVPGTSTSIGFYITEHKRLSEPYSECRHSKSMKLGNNLPYSFLECRNMCIHKIIMDKCGCVSTRFITRNGRNVTSCGHYLFTNKTKSDELMTCQQRQ